MASLDLNTSPRTSVFRKMMEIIRNDPTIKRVFRPTSIRAWDGKIHDDIPFSTDICPAIRFTPTNGPEVWKFPNAMIGDLYLNCEMLVQGTDVDDVMNLWWCIERAFYPRDRAVEEANVRALQEAGSWTGTPEFTQPAFDPSPSNNFFAATGQIKILVRLDFSP